MIPEHVINRDVSVSEQLKACIGIKADEVIIAKDLLIFWQKEVQKLENDLEKLQSDE